MTDRFAADVPAVCDGFHRGFAAEYGDSLSKPERNPSVPRLTGGGVRCTVRDLVLGVGYEAEASVEQPYPFDCESCGYRGFVKAIGSGHGSGESPLFIGMATAKESARRQAKHEANKDARLRIDLAACPRCGRRDRRIVGHLRRRAIRTALLSAIMLSAALYLFAPHREAFPWRLIVPGASLFAIVLYLLERRRWTAPDRNVTFVERRDPKP
jgi:hypothetical protein